MSQEKGRQPCHLSLDLFSLGKPSTQSHNVGQKRDQESWTFEREWELLPNLSLLFANSSRCSLRLLAIRSHAITKISRASIQTEPQEILVKNSVHGE